MSRTRRGPIGMPVRIACGILGVPLFILGVVAAFRHPIGGLTVAVFGMLFLIPALWSRPGDDIPRIASRYHRMRHVMWFGLITGFVGLGVLRSLDSVYPPGSASLTLLGRALIWVFSGLWFLGFIAGFFSVYYSDQALQMAADEAPEEPDGED